MAKANCGAVRTSEAEMPIELDRFAEELGVDVIKTKNKKNKGG